MQCAYAPSNLHYIDGISTAGIQFIHRSHIFDSVSSPLTGGAVMKLIHSLKNKIRPEKNLKSYAWYIWY
ncbi:tryptorubin family RiPP precursor [Streptomyces sp. NBC_01387]|uniref:tryptorubin family RiPP precursor n=1 Tax=Streptomyces sp. NBC_01387 TaxID=2903849 RepID=UPI00386958EC